jgi:hypothetical protein
VEVSVKFATEGGVLDVVDVSVKFARLFYSTQSRAFGAKMAVIVCTVKQVRNTWFVAYNAE